MNLSTILGIANASLEIAKSFISMGKDASPIIAKVIGILTKGENATQADVDSLRADNDAWSAEIQQPLPPEED
jgi:hypothetical protein